jgi:hypothetical protein
VDVVVNEFSHHWLSSICEAGTLYFSSGREADFGGRNLYRSRRVGGVHQEPEYLGSVINIGGTEHTPIITADGRFRFFIGSGDVWWVRADFIEAAGEDVGRLEAPGRGGPRPLQRPRIGSGPPLRR